MQADTRPPFPLGLWPLALLCGVWLLAVALGHDPWKTEDAIHIGIAHGFATSGDWLLPRLAGEVWPDLPSLYHWVAALLGTLLGGLLPFHDAARLASPLFGALALLLLALTARTWHGPEAGRAAPLLLIGSIGLLVPLHEAQPAAAVLAGHAALYAGLALPEKRSRLAGLLMGLGLAVAFLSDGLSGVLPVLPLLLWPLAKQRWQALAIAVCSLLALGGGWLALLASSHPAPLALWWQTELQSVAPTGWPDRSHAKFLAWFAWPVLPLAGWAVWAQRRRLSQPGMAIPFIGLLCALIAFLLREPRPASSLALMPPLVLLATVGADRLRRGAANALDWFGMMTFSLVIALIWLGGIAMLTGWPPKIARNFAKLEPGFVAQTSLFALAVAGIATLVWLAALGLRRSPWRAAVHWSIGLTVMWVVVAALWLPWIDYGKTYRPVAASLAQALPPGAGCIARIGLGPAQRASLDYFAGIRTVSNSRGQECPLVLVQGGSREAEWVGWEKLWEGRRPGDKSERFRLYRR